MGRRKQKAVVTAAAPRVRIKLHIDGDAIGAGKVDLLRHVDRHGGISPAARAMGITFRRAWYLIDTMNSALGGPVVETEVGGAHGGGAQVTPLGRELIAHFEALTTQVAPAAEPILAWLRKQRNR